MNKDKICFSKNFVLSSLLIISVISFLLLSRNINNKSITYNSKAAETEECPFSSLKKCQDSPKDSFTQYCFRCSNGYYKLKTSSPTPTKTPTTPPLIDNPNTKITPNTSRSNLSVSPTPIAIGNLLNVIKNDFKNWQANEKNLWKYCSQFKTQADCDNRKNDFKPKNNGSYAFIFPTNFTCGYQIFCKKCIPWDRDYIDYESCN